MRTPAEAELLVRAAALYGPIALVAALAIRSRPDRRRAAGAVVATAWQLPALLVVNGVAVELGWWRFAGATPSVAGVPLDRKSVV